MTIEYYNQHSKEFCKNTFDLDMSGIYPLFCQHLNIGARILDAGCGSGRDIIAFKNMGYNVEAFDASPKIAALASKNSGIDVSVSKFSDYKTKEKFDGIWCCGSLLHTPLDNLIYDINNLLTALKQNGVWYMSFKYGNKECYRDGRHFTYMDEIGLEKVISQIENLNILQTWITEDVRPERPDKWLNAILKKV